MSDWHEEKQDEQRISTHRWITNEANEQQLRNTLNCDFDSNEIAMNDWREENTRNKEFRYSEEHQLIEKRILKDELSSFI